VVKYAQRGEEHQAEYPVIVLARPRLLGVQSRLVSERDSIVILGSGFSDHVNYLCQYRERGLTGNPEALSQSIFVSAIDVKPTEVTCPPIIEAAAFLQPGSGEGFRCLDIVLKDLNSGLTFGPEPGSPAESLATTCLITRVDALVAPGPPTPSKLPLASSIAQSVPLNKRILLFPLVADSALLGLLNMLREPLGSIKLRFENVVDNGGITLELVNNK